MCSIMKVKYIQLTGMNTRIGLTGNEHQDRLFNDTCFNQNSLDMSDNFTSI